MEKVEMEVLKKYINGAIIDEKDRNILEDLRRIGYIRFGATCEKDTILPTAKVTDLGERIFKLNMKIL